jgi:hypothetical protein
MDGDDYKAYLGKAKAAARKKKADQEPANP